MEGDNVLNTSATWDRKVVVGTDDLGNPAYSSASGFPRTVYGDLQNIRATASERRSGFGSSFERVFFSESFTDGLIGDRVTISGVEYVVNDVAKETTLDGSGTSYAKYAIAKVE